MYKLRALLMGVLLLSGGLAALEYTARHAPERLPEEWHPSDPLMGWAPCDHAYLKPGNEAVANQSSSAASGPRVNQLGFRSQIQECAAEQIQFVCLGNERVFAPEIPERQTFVGQWNSSVTSQGPEQPGVVNGGMPQGCPLAWQLQSERRAACLNAHWICFVDETTPEADTAIRRGTLFNASGKPEQSVHPLATTEKTEPPTNKPFFMDSVLIRRAVPQLFSLLLGESPDDRATIESPPQLTSRDEIFRALEPLVQLREQIESHGGRLTVVYLPRYTADPVESQNQQEFAQVLSQFTAAHQLATLDLTPFLQPQNASVPFTNTDGQLTIEGHTQAAAYLQRYFQPSLAGGVSPADQNNAQLPRR